MRRILIVFSALVFLVILGIGHGAVAGQFVPGIDDLPLMTGLTIKSDGALHYDTPSGRIVDVKSSGNVGRQKVSDFYAETLPQLGWAATSPGVYRRDNEILKIIIGKGDHQPVSVQFSLVPAGVTAGPPATPK